MRRSPPKAGRPSPTQRVTVRGYVPSDLAACQRIRGEAIDFDQYLRLPGYDFLVAEDEGGEVVGYAVMQVWQWNRSGWLADLYVSDDRRFAGYGRALMERLKRVAKERGCTTLVDYVPADADYLPFYFKLGFRVHGYHAYYFSDQEGHRRDAIIFGCPLRGATGMEGGHVERSPGARARQGR